jgi:hypothetical protein
VKKTDKPAHKLIHPVPSDSKRFQAIPSDSKRFQAIPSDSPQLFKMSTINYETLFRNDSSFRDSINQINAKWNNLEFIQTGNYTDSVFVHPVLNQIDWREYGTCYGKFFDDEKVKNHRMLPLNKVRH